MANLIMHKYGSRVTEAEVRAVPAVDFTNTWRPYRHGIVLDAVNGALGRKGLEITRGEYGLSNDGFDMFAVLHVKADGLPVLKGTEPSLGVRSSMAKRLSLGLCVGFHTFVCDNLAFHSDVVLFRKHTGRLSEEEILRLADDAVGQIAPRMRHLTDWMTVMAGVVLSKSMAIALFGAAVVAGVLPGSQMESAYEALYRGDHYESDRGNLRGWYGAVTEVIGQRRSLVGYHAANKKVNDFILPATEYAIGRASLDGVVGFLKKEN